MLNRHATSFFRATQCKFNTKPISFHLALLGPWSYRFLSTARKPSTLLLVEHQNNEILPPTYNVLSAAQTLDQPLSFLVCIHDKELPSALLSKLAKYQPAAVWVVSHPSFAKTIAPELLATSLVDLLQKQSYSHVFAAHSSLFKNALPRAAAQLDLSMIADVVQVHDAKTFTRPIYAGNAFCKLSSNDPIQIVTVRPTAFPAAPAPSSSSSSSSPSPSPQTVACTSPLLSEFVSESKAKSDRPELDTAKIVVAGGRGMKSAEHFQMLYALADKLGAAVGASRAAVDAGYVDNALQIGQTGKVVAPSLYLGVGISGAIQHLAGMKDAKVICAINNDPDAPIFHVADYGLVADLFEAVPELTKKV